MKEIKRKKEVERKRRKEKKKLIKRIPDLETNECTRIEIKGRHISKFVTKKEKISLFR